MLFEAPTSDGSEVHGGYFPPLDGAIRNLWIRAGELGSVAVSYEWDSALGGEAVRVWIYINRDPVAVVRAGEVWRSLPLGDEVTEIVLVVVRASDAGPPSIDGEIGGDQFLLDWIASADDDVAAYIIYWDNATGTVSYAAPYKTLSRVVSVSSIEAAPTSGTGTGRVTIDGTYIGDVRNGVCALEVTGAGVWQLDLGDGPDGVDRDILQGAVIGVLPGVRAVFLDAVASYHDGDRFEWFVGVESRYVSAPQDAGTYKFTVKARDVAGNLSAASTEKSITIVDVLEPPTNQSATFDAGDDEITIVYTDPADGDVTNIGIFTNYDATTETLTSYVKEDAPWQVVRAGEGGDTFSVAGLPRGEWLFYARSGDAAGNRERNATLFRVTIYDDPPAVLAAINIIEAVPAAGGKITLTYSVNRATGTPVLVNVYTGASAGSLSLAESISFTGTSYPVQVETDTTTDTFSGTVYVMLRGVDGSGNLGPMGNVVAVTVDDDAPDAPTWGLAVPT